MEFQVRMVRWAQPGHQDLGDSLGLTVYQEHQVLRDSKVNQELELGAMERLELWVDQEIRAHQGFKEIQVYQVTLGYEA